MELSGQADEKPFECVGTIDEVNAALNSILKEKRYKLMEDLNGDHKLNINDLLDNFEDENLLKKDEIEILKSDLYD